MNRFAPLLLAVCIGLAGCTDETDGGEETDSDTGTLPEVCPFESLQLLPLGNSITQGEEEHFTYRYDLWRRFLDLGCNVDYVGTMDTNRTGEMPGWPEYEGHSFDPDHEGHWGWRADELAGALPAWLAEYRYDTVLLHAGTNDFFAEETPAEVYADLVTLVQLLQESNPVVVVFVATLIPTGYSDINAGIDGLNDLLRSGVESLSTVESPVRLVEMASAVDDTMLYDNLHPGTEGEEAMAERWFVDLVQYYEGL